MQGEVLRRDIEGLGSRLCLCSVWLMVWGLLFGVERLAVFGLGFGVLGLGSRVQGCSPDFKPPRSSGCQN